LSSGGMKRHRVLTWMRQQEKADVGETERPSRVYGELLKGICEVRESGGGSDLDTGKTF
jgi:hypothetical protein